MQAQRRAEGRTGEREMERGWQSFMRTSKRSAHSEREENGQNEAREETLQQQRLGPPPLAALSLPTSSEQRSNCRPVDLWLPKRGREAGRESERKEESEQTALLNSSGCWLSGLW